MKSATTCSATHLPLGSSWFGRASALGLIGLLTLLGGCSSGGSSGAGAATPQSEQDDVPDNTGNVELLEIQYGRLVDVYGLERTSTGGLALKIFQRDVVIGPEIQDERPTGSLLEDSEVQFDFLAADPETLQPVLLIPREIGSDDFNRLFDRLDDGNKLVNAGVFGQDVATQPYAVVPRNAALRLKFSESLGINETFFVTQDEPVNPDDRPVVTGVRNTEAIQLLTIVGDPLDDDDEGDFRLLDSRIIPRGDEVIIDPVFLGTEGVEYETRNNAAGMPESSDQLTANIRIAIALEGPLSISGIRAEDGSQFVGRNHTGALSVIRDFRSGNSQDSSPDLSGGFIRDAEPPRLVGAIPFLLEAVEDFDPSTQILTLFKNGRQHEVDRGDILRIVDQNSGAAFLTEVSGEPDDDTGRPEVQHVRVPVRRIEGLSGINPVLRSDYPANPANAAGEAWLRQNAPRAVLLAEFTARRFNTETGGFYGDDPTNFLTFTPEPLPQAAGFDPFPGQPSLPNVNISPFAGAIVRFSKPVALETVKAFDTFFFATRDVLSPEAIEAFKDEYSLSDEQFNLDKFITPHLVDARNFDESGSQTTLRLQPVKGFYLDDAMREVSPPDFIDIDPSNGDDPIGGDPADPHPGLVPERYSGGSVATTTLPYFLHIVGGLNGIRDLAGNPIDFQSETGGVDQLAIPFFLDGRTREDGSPYFENNLVVNIVRRFQTKDEDEQPSLYRIGGDPNEYPFPMDDIFGAVSVTADGRLVSRPASRVTKIVDNLNQQPPPGQETLLRWCPLTFSGEGTQASNSAAVAFGAGIQNPNNPWGARLQTVWREIDMSLSRVDPFDFNLDVEQLYWAPLTTASIFFDIFDNVSLYLGHSEFRPEPCVGQFTALPVFTNSGLKPRFDDNYANNPAATGTGQDIELKPAPHAAYEGAEFTINPPEAILEPNGINRFLPLPEFQKPYFVWRDETSPLQGGMTRQGDDTTTGGVYSPYIISPWLAGKVLPQFEDDGIQVNNAFWDNRVNFHLNAGVQDLFTGGLLGTIALPLLADFQTTCDSADLPAGFGFIANGFNGWQISLSVQSSPSPNFRVFSGGAPDQCVSSEDPGWTQASGQVGVGVQGDNSVYWIMADFLKRQTVATSGFIELNNPHRMPDGFDAEDPRLGPYDNTLAALNGVYLPDFEWHFEPPLSSLPSGTGLVPEFRAASNVTTENWNGTSTGPLDSAGTAAGIANPAFPLNPLVAGDAHIRKYDRRPFNGTQRNYWTHYYTQHLTRYTSDVQELMSNNFLNGFAGPNANDTFTNEEVQYFNWRFVMTANTEVSPPVSPGVESFALSYRFERVQ